MSGSVPIALLRLADGSGVSKNNACLALPARAFRVLKKAGLWGNHEPYVSRLIRLGHFPNIEQWGWRQIASLHPKEWELLRGCGWTTAGHIHIVAVRKGKLRCGCACCRKFGVAP